MARKTRRPRVASAGPTFRQKFMASAADVLVLAIGVGVNFSIHFVGDLYLAEVLLLLTLPALVFLRGRRALATSLRPFYIFLGIWLLGQVIADASNHTALYDRVRGSALIVFFGLNVLGLSILLSHNEKRKVIFFFGLAVGALASVKLQPSPAVEDYPWKFGYGWGTMLLVMLVASYLYSRRRYVGSELLVLGLCGINLIFNFRSPILMLMLTLALVYPIIPEQIGGLRILPESQLLRLVTVAILAIGAAGIADASVKFVTRAGYISEDAQAKNEAQERSGTLLLGGRPEFTVGLQAALDSPIIGHGSWAKDFKYFEILNDTLVEEGVVGYNSGFDLGEDIPLIPGHSHIVTAWIWAGIGGLVFWLYVIFFVLRGITLAALTRPPFAPIYAYLLINMFWDILFSPFGANRRTIEAALIVIVADMAGRRLALVETSWRRMGAAAPRPALAPPSDRTSTSTGLR